MDNISSLAHCSGFLKNIFNLLNNPYLIKDEQWLPLDKESLNKDTSTNEKVYSEVTSGNWYKRTYDSMIVKHRKKHTIYPPLLVAIVLG